MNGGRLTQITRRLFRLAVSGLCLLPLLACVGAGWLWWRSYRGDQCRLSFRRADTRYTVRSAGSRLTLFRAPPDPAKGNGPAVADLAARIRNAELEWVIARWDDGTFHGFFTLNERPADSGAAPPGVPRREWVI